MPVLAQQQYEESTIWMYFSSHSLLEKPPVKWCHVSCLIPLAYFSGYFQHFFSHII